MKYFKYILFVFLLLIIVSPVFSQDEDNEEIRWNFLLTPILETVFSGNLQWRPDWPVDFPPDAFLVNHENRRNTVIELSNGNENYLLRRDREGRLIEFPYFFTDGVAKVQAIYGTSSVNRNITVLQRLNITYIDLTITKEEGERIQENGESTEEDVQTVVTFSIIFPAEFSPYSELSMGGSFPPLEVRSGDLVFYIFIFESPIFLTETWYNEDGNMLIFSKASTIVEDGKFKIRSLQIHDAAGTRFVDYSFDSFNNITEVHYDERLFSAYYRNKLPTYWQRDALISELQWDTQGLLTIIKTSDNNGNFLTEYRYRYEFGTFGFWNNRLETAYIIQFDLLAPHLSSNRGIWTRRIIWE
jgi:hypothetical protein